MNRSEGDVFLKDWCIVVVGGFLSFKDLGRWDVAMSSQRKNWLQGLSNVKIPDIDGYEHSCNESIQWLISHRIQCVTKIAFLHKEDAVTRLCSKTFFGGHVLTNLKSIELGNYITDSILDSLKVNCHNLEEVVCNLMDQSNVGYAAAARMVQKLPHLRCFTYTGDTNDYSESPKPFLLSLAQYCPLLETLELAKYEDEGLAELVAGCPKLHTLTIECDTSGITLAGYRALGRSRSITSLNFSTSFISVSVSDALGAMADEGMPLKTLNLYTVGSREGSADHISGVVRFAQTLENLSLQDFSEFEDHHLEVLSQCHKLRSIHLSNTWGGDHVTGSFLLPMSIGCPLLENVSLEFPLAHHVNFKPFFERCPNLKEFNVDIHTDEEVQALARHCPLMKSVSLGSSDGNVLQEHSVITDDSLVAMAQNLHFLTKVSLNYTQCTDAGLLLFAKGKCRHVMKDF